MQKDKPNPYIDHSSWLDCLGQLNESQQVLIQSLPSYDQLMIKQLIQPEKGSPQNNLNQQMLQLISLHQCVDKQLFKRSHPQSMIDEEFFTSNSSSNDNRMSSERDSIEGVEKSGYKKQKYAKQYIYSKNYRDKKKYQFRALQQQNQFLKSKVDQLQMRLRQKQIQINRLKHHSTQKDLTIEQLNRQFLTKVSLFAEKIQKSISSNQITKQMHSPFQKTKILFYDELIKTYDEHGFAGSRKRQLLNYYINQILEVVLRDSQKYLCMLCAKNKDDKLEKEMPEYQKINTAFFQIMQIKQQEKERLRKYIQFLYPVMKQMKKHCSDLYKSYSKITECMDRVHQFMRSSYAENLDFVKKRMKFQSWFEYHKYHKIMRKLKSQWLQFIKNEKSPDLDSKNKRRYGIKRKKTDQSNVQY